METTADKLFFMECHLAGRMYYDATEAWHLLHVGTCLQLVRDRDNAYDHDAVAVMLPAPPDGDGQPARTYKLGYLPSAKNSVIAQFMDMGWSDAFECRISQIKPDEHYEQQVRLTIRICRRPPSQA